MKSSFIRNLKDRGLIHQATDLDALDELASTRKIAAYIGFDLTAPSLHVGSLVQIMVLRALLEEGHKAVVVLGTSTTQVGDPSGKQTSRPVLPISQIEQNLVGIENVIERLVPGVEFIENDWFNMNYIEFLRHYGPLFTVNRMLTLDSVKSRLDRKEPMTFLEFNYSILQSIDFLELSSRGVDLQIGGSDQWGNIVSGADLTRRVMQKPVFGLTTPLLTNSAGQKMGKTASGAIWLDSELTSVFDFWQFWRNIEDEKVDEFLKMFASMKLDADINKKKIALADAVTTLVHGRDAAERARETAEQIMAGGIGSETPSFHMNEDALIVDALLVSGFVSSKSDADRQAKNGGIRLNGEVVTDVRQPLKNHLQSNNTIRLSFGKKKVAIIHVR